MENEQKTEPTVTDSALDQAAETTEEEVIQPEEKSQEAEAGVSETEEEKAKQAKKEEQRERSALGRKVKMLEEKFDKFLEKAEAFYQNPQHIKSDEPAYQGDELLTVAEAEKFLEQRELRKARQQSDAVKKYEGKYLDTFARLGVEEDLNDDDFTKIEEIMRKSFNVSYSQYTDPIADAERNFLKAVRAYEKGKSSKPKSPNLKGDTPKGTGVTGAGDIKEKSLKMPELDSYAKDFVNYHKIKEETVAKALEGETPMRLKRRQ